MPHKVIQTSSAPAAIGPYSQAVMANGFLFVSGQIPLSPLTGELVTGTIGQEARQVMLNIEAILQAAGLMMQDIVKATIFLTDLGDFVEVNEVYGSYFSAEPPARATVQVSALPKGARVEVEVIAAAG